MDEAAILCDICKEAKENSLITRQVVTALSEKGESYHDGVYKVTDIKYTDQKEITVKICQDCLRKHIQSKTKGGIKLLSISSGVLMLLFLLAMVLKGDSDLVALFGFVAGVSLLALLLYRGLMKNVKEAVSKNQIDFEGYYGSTWFKPFFFQTAKAKACPMYEKALEGKDISTFTIDRWKMIAASSKLNTSQEK